MANIHGIEVSGEVYDLEDTSARTTATTASSAASSASNLASTANQNANTASQVATQASTKASENANAIIELQNDIEDIQNVVPSIASSSNKLTTDQDLSGLCSIVTTLQEVQSGFQINNSTTSSPGVYWSVNIIPVLPAPNAILINVQFHGTTWFPNLIPVTRGQRVFNLLSPSSYTLSQDVYYICVWAIPKS